jgi:hypothetical protein
MTHILKVIAHRSCNRLELQRTIPGIVDRIWGNVSGFGKGSTNIYIYIYIYIYINIYIVRV